MNFFTEKIAQNFAKVFQLAISSTVFFLLFFSVGFAASGKDLEGISFKILSPINKILNESIQQKTKRAKDSSFFQETIADLKSLNVKVALANLSDSTSPEFLISSQLINQTIDSVKNVFTKNVNPTPGDILDLAKTIFLLREKVIVFGQKNQALRSSIHDHSFLLQLLAEELLAYGRVLYRDQLPTQFWLALKATSEQAQTDREFVIHDIEIKSGDILLSKSTGSLSSSFISQTTVIPHLFSHSTPAYLAQGQLLSPEAFIEDGLKIRPIHIKSDLSLSGGKTRLFVVRGRGVLSQKMSQGIDSWIQKLLKGTSLTKYLETSRSLAPYDFNFDLEDNSKLSCYESANVAASTGGIVGTQLPFGFAFSNYFKKDLSSLFQQILGVAQPEKAIAAPGDILLHPSYQLVGFGINTEKLLFERIEYSAVSGLLYFLIQTPAFTQELVSTLSQERQLDFVVTPELLQKFKGLTPNAELEEQLKAIPAGVTLRQLLFFVTLNKILGPSVHKIAKEKATSLASHLELRTLFYQIFMANAPKYLSDLKLALKTLK